MYDTKGGQSYYKYIVKEIKAMKNDWSGSVAVITGAGGGIGRAVAEMLAAEKMKIVFLGGNNIAKLNETKEKIKDLTECLVIPGDLTKVSEIPAKFKQVEDTFGGIDILINNAGIALNRPLEETTEEQYDKIMNINVKAPYFLMQAALPYLSKSENATVINIASVVAHAGYPYQSAYAASKHALLGLTKSFAREVYKEGIRVHAISPGGVYTDMVKVARPDLTPDGMIRAEEIAEIVQFLLKFRGNAVIDEIGVHRLSKEPFL